MEYTEFYFGNDYLYAKIELTVQIPFDFFENYCSPLFMQFFFSQQTLRIFDKGGQNLMDVAGSDGDG